MNREDVIRSKVETYCQAIATQDEDAFRSLWADENQTLISVGTVFSGIDSIYHDFLIGGIQKAYASIRLVAENLQIRSCSSNLIVVIFEYRTECIRRETGEPYGIRGVETQLFVFENDDWKLTHLHYSKV